jgi:hypothetical protein
MRRPTLPHPKHKDARAADLGLAPRLWLEVAQTVEELGPGCVVSVPWAGVAEVHRDPIGQVGAVPRGSR